MTKGKPPGRGSIPVTVNLQFHRPDEAGFLSLKGILEVAEGELSPSPTTGRAVDSNQGIVSRLQRIQEWERTHFPHWTPKISHELFKMLGQGKLEDKAFTVKEIVHATGFSERAIRKQLDRFESHGWITRGRNHLDRRNSHIQPSDALKKAYQEWLSLHVSA